MCCTLREISPEAGRCAGRFFAIARMFSNLNADISMEGTNSHDVVSFGMQQMVAKQQGGMQNTYGLSRSLDTIFLIPNDTTPRPLVPSILVSSLRHVIYCFLLQTCPYTCMHRHGCAYMCTCTLTHAPVHLQAHSAL